MLSSPEFPFRQDSLAVSPCDHFLNQGSVATVSGWAIEKKKKKTLTKRETISNKNNRISVDWAKAISVLYNCLGSNRSFIYIFSLID